MRGPVRIVPNVYMVGNSEITDSLDCCVYLVDSGDLVLIDAGAGRNTDRLLDNIQVLGLTPEKLSTILVKHAHIDHAGSLHELQERYCVKIIAHEADSRALESGIGVGAEYYGVKYEPCKVDVQLKGGENTLRIGSHGFKIMHVPGHTPGSVAVILETEAGIVLFGQDIHGPYHPRWCVDPVQAVKSLQKIHDINADILCEGHYGVIRPGGRVREFIQEFIDNLP